jgi:DNA adenine methylase
MSEVLSFKVELAAVGHHSQNVKDVEGDRVLQNPVTSAVTPSGRLIGVPTAVKTAPKIVLPPLKWAGGKRWQVPHLLPIWQSHSSRRLVEPFCGGLAVSLGLRPQGALLNDANHHLINFYQWLQKGLNPSIQMENDEDLFYRYRERFNELVRDRKSNSREAAQLFYYMNRTAYNGLCRFNGRGEFNAPFGQYKTIAYAKSFEVYRDVFADWRFTSGDFANMRLEDEDFIYADPPYDVEFTAYSQGGFSWEDQVRTAETLAKHPGPVILVNQATRRITALYRKLRYALEYHDAPRRISCTGDRTPAKEVFATRNL